MVMSASLIISMTLDSFCIAITIVLFFCLKLSINKKNKLTKLFTIMLFVHLMMLSSGIFSWMLDGSAAPYAYPVLVVSSFLLFFCGYVLKVYISKYLFTFISFKIKPSIIFPVCFYSLGAASAVLLVISQFTGWMYSYSETNVYQRGDFYWLLYFGPALIFFLDLIMLFIYSRKLNSGDFKALFVVGLVPILAMLVQLLYSNILLFNPALTLSLLFLYVWIQMAYTEEITVLRNKAEEQNLTIKNGIQYARKIQRNLLPKENVLSNVFVDHSVIWKPRDVVGGDIYWLSQFDRGLVLCVIDCTGHGMPGALLTMLVVSTLEGVVWQNNCHDTSGIIWRINERLMRIFNTSEDGLNKDGCDIAVLFIENGGNVAFSGAHMSVFVCNGKEARRIKGNNIFVGEGRLKNMDDIHKVLIPANQDNKFYIASDGLFDQPGGANSESFGYRAFKNIILENHAEKQSVISGKIWDAFEKHRGTEPMVDDIELITFKPYVKI